MNENQNELTIGDVKSVVAMSYLLMAIEGMAMRGKTDKDAVEKALDRTTEAAVEQLEKKGIKIYKGAVQ